MINLEPDPASPTAAPPAFGWLEVEWTAADYKRARAILIEAEEIAASLTGRWMADGHNIPRRRAWFDKAAALAADASDAVSELCTRIDELMRPRPMGGSNS